MKILIFLASLISFGYVFNIIAQIDTSWVKRFNGPLNAADAGRVIKVDDDGFVYVGASIAKTPGYTDAAVIKYNPFGDTLWLRYYNNPVNNGSSVNDMFIDSNGNIVVTGQCGGFNYDDGFTVKFDSSGNTLWTQRYDGGDIDRANAAVTDDLGNVYVTGDTWKVYESDNIVTIKYNSAGDTIWSSIWCGPEDASDLGKDLALDIYGNLLFGGTCDWYWGTIDYVIIKLSQVGNIVWIKKYDSPDQGHDYLKAIATDNDGNIYVTGSSYKITGTFDIITVKYDANGDTIWTRRYNGAGNGDDVVNDMLVDSLGNIFLCGSSFVSGNGIDCLTLKYNSDGVLVWAKTYAEYSYHSDAATSLALDGLGNVYVTGTAGTSSSNIAYLTIKYDNSGNEKWVTLYDGPGNNGYDVASSICVDNSNYVYITGSSTGLISGRDIATIKYVQGPNAVDDNLSGPLARFVLEQNYPNPFNPSTKIKYSVPQTSQVQIKIFDVLGNEIKTLINEEKPIGTYEVEFNVSSLSSSVSAKGGYASGVYFYQLKAGDFISTKKMILLK